MIRPDYDLVVTHALPAHGDIVLPALEAKCDAADWKVLPEVRTWVFSPHIEKGIDQMSPLKHNAVVVAIELRVKPRCWQVDGTLPTLGMQDVRGNHKHRPMRNERAYQA